MKNFILSIQHLLAMFGATVLVPILTGFDPSVAIFCAGLGTLIFHLCTKGKVPVFLGSSFAFIPVVISANQISNGDRAFAQGGIIIAGLIYVILSFLIKFIGIDKIKKYFPPQVTGAMIAVIGLNLLPSAIDMAIENLMISIITLSIAILINVYGKGFIKQLGILLAVTSGYIISLIFGEVDITSILNANLFQIPNFTLPKFSLEAIIIIAPIVIAVFMEHVGDMTTNGTVVGKNFIEDPGLNKTLLGDGLATIISGLIGGPANTTYGENTSVVGLTKVASVWVIGLAAIIAIVIGFLGKFTALVQTIPNAVLGGVSLLLYGFIAVNGLKVLIKNQINFDDPKNVVVASSMLVLGLGGAVISIISGDLAITISGMSLAAVVGILLNLILPAQKSETTKKSNGKKKETVKA